MSEKIRPLSDLHDNFADIFKTVHETGEPVFLTKNGFGNIVVMSMDTFNRLQFESEIYSKLKEAETEAKLSNIRLTHEEVFSELRKKITA